MRLASLALAGLAGCLPAVPPVQYYRLALQEELPRGESTGEVLAVEVMEVDAVYDDPRIVYRESEYELDYYHYHQWSAQPGTAIADFLQAALAQTGRFSAVLRDPSPETTLLLGGRLQALEEVDRSKDRWVGHLALELRLREPRTGEILWTRRFDIEEPLVERSPKGLARAASSMLARVVVEAAPRIAEIAAQHDRPEGSGGSGQGSQRRH